MIFVFDRYLIPHMITSYDYPIKIVKEKILTDNLLLDFSSLYYNIIFHIYNKLYY